MKEGTPAMADSPWLTKTEAARRLRVSTRTLDRWVRRGLVRRYEQGAVFRFKPEDVDAAMEGKAG